MDSSSARRDSKPRLFSRREALRQELESVRTDFLTQATGAGLEAETAQADAEVWAAFARTAHRRFGIRPREFSDMVGLEIRQGREVAAGAGYSQVDAEARLSRDVASWSETVDRVLAQKVPSRQQLPVMTTPLVFNLVGADVLPVVMDADKVSRILKEHSGMGIEQIKQVPAALADPIAIFESTKTKESGNRSLVAMLEMKDKNMATVLVPLHLDVRVQGDRREVVVNRLASVYGKERDGVPNDGWFQRQVDAGRLLYLNEKKSLAWGRSSGPLVTATADGTPQATLSEKSIKTESDLVKFRSAMCGWTGIMSSLKGTRKMSPPSVENRLYEERG